MKIILFFIFYLPLLLSAQVKKKASAIVIKNAQTYIKQAESLLAKGDTIKACINFMRAKSLGHYKLPHYYDDGNEDDQNIDDVEKYCYDENFQIKSEIANNAEFKKLNYPPLEFATGEVFNDGFGDPVLKVEMRNSSSKIVDAYRCVVKCYNRFGEPVKGIENSNTGIITDQQIIEPGEAIGNIEGYHFTFFQGISKIKITLIKVHFKDGRVWTPMKGQTFTSTVTSAQ